MAERLAATGTVEVWVCVDQDGNHGTGTDSDRAKADYEDVVGSLSEADGHRLYCLTLTVPLPQLVTLEGTVPEEGGAVALTVT